MLEVFDAPIKAKNPKLPENSGKPWIPELDKQLCDMHDCGALAKERCDYFKRSRDGVAARLVRLGKIENRADLE